MGNCLFHIEVIYYKLVCKPFIMCSLFRAGVLYMLSSPSYKVPMKVFPLINGSCRGARRVYHYSRPHTFQIVVDKTVLYLAAPDEYVASDWLQALVHAASGVRTDC